MTVPMAVARHLTAPFAVLVAGMVMPSADAQPRLPARSSLIAERGAVTPGSNVVVAVRQRLAPGWHSYWRNPGNVGQATRIAWRLPAGWRAGEIAWPTPHRYRMGEFTNFVYSDEVVLPVRIAIPADAPPGLARLDATVTSLLCRDLCIPSRETVSLTLNIAAANGPRSADAAAIADSLGRIERRRRAIGVVARDERGGWRIAAPGVTQAAAFFPFEAQGVDSDAPITVRETRDGVVVTLASRRGATSPRRIAGILAGGEGRSDIALVATAGTLPDWATGDGDGAAGSGVLALFGYLILAFGGGVILNAMPCVFPILAGKVAALAGSAGERGALRREALAYCAGCLVAFIALAATLMALRAMGQAAGWGFQLQSPLVVALLALVMLASALNLAGVFEAGLGLQRAAGNARVGTDAGGGFLTGVLAAVVAAPCTAPLMAPAIGWALTQPAPVALAVFATLGLGLGLPFLVLAWMPGAARSMPRPGPWLARLRQALAFPMLAGAAWLTWVFVVQKGAAALPGLFAAFIALALALWCWGVGQRVMRGGRWYAAAALVTVTAIPGGLVLAVASPAPVTAATTGERWSSARIAALRAEGRPVLLDVTAAWCITCKVNERVALNSEEVRRAMARTGARVVTADWTRSDPAITRLLADHGRSGVPFYLLYTPDGREIELPQILTPRVVARAIDGALSKEK